MCEEKELGDLIEEWQDVNQVYHFEGDSGLEKFELLCKALGYGHQFRFGDPIQAMLSDNPGAIEAIIEWMSDRNPPEWREALVAALDNRQE